MERHVSLVTLAPEEYHLAFAEAFYTGTWFQGFNQEETLSKIDRPVVYPKASTAYGSDGVLYAANSDEDAEKVHRLIKGSEMINIKPDTILILSIRMSLSELW